VKKQQLHFAMKCIQRSAQNLQCLRYENGNGEEHYVFTKQKSNQKLICF